MPPVELKDKSGRVLMTVDAPDGASREDIITLAKQQKAPKYPVVSPETPGLITPTASGYLAEGLRRRSGDILAMTGGAPPPAGRSLRAGARWASSLVSPPVRSVRTSATSRLGRRSRPAMGRRPNSLAKGSPRRWLRS